MKRRQVHPGHVGEAGHLTFFGLGLVLVVLFVGGISLDLWRIVGERRSLAEMADAAAAAGANGIDPTAYRQTGLLVLDPARARQLATRNLAEQRDVRALDRAPFVLADTDVVVVEVSGRVELTLLGIFMPNESFPVTVRAEARPRRGQLG